MLSDHAKAFAIFDGHSELFLHLLFGLVVGQQQLIEASMGHWQLFLVISLNAQNELDVFKACDGHPGGARGESQQLLSVLVIEVLVNYFPEPFHELVVRMERLDIFGYSLQLLEIQVFGSANELLKLLGAVQVAEDVLVEDLVEPSFESYQLD